MKAVAYPSMSVTLSNDPPGPFQDLEVVRVHLGDRDSICLYFRVEGAHLHIAAPDHGTLQAFLWACQAAVSEHEAAEQVPEVGAEEPWPPAGAQVRVLDGGDIVAGGVIDAIGDSLVEPGCWRILVADEWYEVASFHRQPSPSVTWDAVMA